jgi:poly(A) polymerase
MTEREFAADIVRRLRSAGHQALCAGGCVRDQLLGLDPHDYDVATDARPDQVQALFRRTVAVGISFGVVEVLGPKPLKVQVATFRSDGDYDDGRRPKSVTFSSPEEDARRRDFTINGIFFDPIDERVIDYVGGEADLRAGIVRAIGDPRQRFTEDKLRLLRAVRFAARFQFTIEPATAAAISEMADQITVVSAERIADELRKMLTHRHRAAGLRLVEDAGLAKPIFPEVAGAESWKRAPAVLEQFGEPVSFPLALAGILFSIDPKIVATIADRLRLSNVDKERLVWLVGRHAALVDAPNLPKCDLKPLLAHPGIGELLALHRAIARAVTMDEKHAEFCERCLREWPRETIDPPPLITGDDLRDMGLLPGPRFKELLDTVRAAQLNETVTTREQAVELVRTLLPKS